MISGIKHPLLILQAPFPGTLVVQVQCPSTGIQSKKQWCTAGCFQEGHGYHLQEYPGIFRCAPDENDRPS